VRQNAGVTATFTVVGEALVDLVETEPTTFVSRAGGSPFNVAVTLARLGSSVALTARAGRDGFGDLLVDSAARDGVDVSGFERADEPTTLAVATLDERGSARYDFYFDATAGLGWSELPQPRTPFLHVGSIASWRQPSAPLVLDAQQRAHASDDVLVSYDPNVRPNLMDGSARATLAESLRAANLIKTSDEDLDFLHPGADPAEVAARWCRTGASLVVVTHGSDGAVAYGARGELARAPAPRITVVDTVGAGDSFMGGLLAAIADAGLNTPQALRDAVATDSATLGAALAQAVLVSAYTCEQRGANPPTRAQLDAARVRLSR
jgi:fructokinase